MKIKGLKRISINVSGAMFETHERTLERFPDTLLGNECKRRQYFCCNSDQYFFNRNRQSFEAILYFYQSNGNLSRPCNIKFEDFEEECKFFEIPKSTIEFLKQKEGILLIKPPDELPEEGIENPPSTFRSRVWDLLENPETSKGARFLAIFSLITILFSVVLACLETIPNLYVKSAKHFDDPFFLMELSLNSYFLLEVVIRTIFCPNKLDFFTNSLNLIDVIAVVPYFIILCIDINKLTSLGFLRILRFLRVLRLFRLSKHSARIKIVGAIFAESLKDLRLFFVCLMIIAVFSGSLMYFIENTVENSPFTSIPMSMWWALQTVVTLGYGDIVPLTIGGKLYSSLFMVFGAVTISLPVLAIVMKFTLMYSLD